jgi:pimeloyl-[acyl-carrier protein] methyl ester esterase
MIDKNIIFISGWATNNNIWTNVTQQMNNKTISIPWNRCLKEKNNENKLYSTLMKDDSEYTLVGWSLGGIIALNGAINFPKKIKKLLLISSTARMLADTNYNGTPEKHLRSMKIKLQKYKEKVLNDFLSVSFNPERNNCPDEIINCAKLYDTNTLKDGLEYLAKSDFRNKLQNIKCPVNILHGEYDQVIPCANSLYLSEKIEKAQIHIVPNAGHMLPLYHSKLILEGLKKY